MTVYMLKHKVYFKLSKHSVWIVNTHEANILHSKSCWLSCLHMFLSAVTQASSQ